MRFARLSVRSISWLIYVGALLVPTICTHAQLLPPCQLPFESVAEKHPIDACREYKQRYESYVLPGQLEQAYLHNFCASGEAITITLSTLDSLYEGLRAHGSSADYAQRMLLPLQINEKTGLVDKGSRPPLLDSNHFVRGRRVQIEGFMRDAQFSGYRIDIVSNCDQIDKDSRTILVSLSFEPQGDSVITAGVAPFFRPRSWARLPELKIPNPVLVRGQLVFMDPQFTWNELDFDQYWRIHPVYEFFVCINPYIEQCPISEPRVWQSLYEWVNIQDAAAANERAIAERNERTKIPQTFQTDIEDVYKRFLISKDRLVAVSDTVESAKSLLAQPQMKGYRLLDTLLLWQEMQQSLHAVTEVPSLSGIRNYIDKKFPDPPQATFVGQKLGPLVSIGVTEAMISSLELFISKLRTTASHLIVTLQIRTSPDRAEVRLFTFSGGPERAVISDAEMANLYRGLYHYEVQKAGYKRIADKPDINLVDDPKTILRCDLVTEAEVQKALPCSLEGK
jgi:hypothetical protein